MKKRTAIFMWLVIMGFILVLIPYIQNAAAGPTVPGISFFMGYYTSNSFPNAYIWIITLGMVRGALMTLFIKSLLRDIQESGSGPEKFDLNK